MPPLTWVFEPILGAYIVTSSGEIQAGEFFTRLDEILAHPKAATHRRILVDHTRLPTPGTDLVREGLTRLHDYLPRLAGAKVALVVNADGSRSSGPMANIVLDGQLDLQVFNDMASAVLSFTMDGLD